jgi:hypothetical protein
MSDKTNAVSYHLSLITYHCFIFSSSHSPIRLFAYSPLSPFSFFPFAFALSPLAGKIATLHPTVAGRRGKIIRECGEPK